MAKLELVYHCFTDVLMEEISKFWCNRDISSKLLSIDTD